jgi:phenylacetate-CoA ligase
LVTLYGWTTTPGVAPFPDVLEVLPPLLEKGYRLGIITNGSQQALYILVQMLCDPGDRVLTNLGRWGMPLIRYRTGDQVRLTRNATVDGRHFARLEGGILGRCDDMVIVRGNNVFPSAIEDIVRRFEQVAEFRISVDRQRALTELRIEIEPLPDYDDDGLAGRVAHAVRDRLHFRPRVEVVAPGSLPRFEMKAKRLVEINPQENP